MTTTTLAERQLRRIEREKQSRVVKSVASSYKKEYPEADKLAQRLSDETGIKVTGLDYADWMDPGVYDGKVVGDGEKFESATARLLGKTLYGKVESLARLPHFVSYVLGFTDQDNAGGIKLKSLMTTKLSAVREKYVPSVSTRLHALIVSKEKEAEAAEKAGVGVYNRYAGMKCYVCKRRPAAAHNCGACSNPRCVIQSMRDHL